MARRTIMAAIAAFTLTSTVAVAQMTPDFGMIGSAVSGITMPQVMNPCGDDGCGGKGSAGRRRSPAGKPLRFAAALGRPASASAARTQFPFQSSPEMRARTVRDVASRLRSKQPANAAMVEREFTKNDYDKIFQDVAGPSGFRRYDLADAMAAYLVLGWQVVNQTDAPDAAAASMRAQVAQILAADPKVSGPDTRAALGEELKLMFVVIHAGSQDARRTGQTKAFSAEIRQMFVRQMGVDLTLLNATKLGFRPRG